MGNKYHKFTKKMIKKAVLKTLQKFDLCDVIVTPPSQGVQFHQILKIAYLHESVIAEHNFNTYTLFKPSQET